MYCASCGHTVEEGTSFCPVCGTPVQTTAAQETPPAAAAEDGQLKEFRRFLSGHDESILAVLGYGVGHEVMSGLTPRGAFAILSNKRLYVKGKSYRKNSSVFLPRKEEHTIDIKDVNGTGCAAQNARWMLVLGLIGLVIAFVLMASFGAMVEANSASGSKKPPENPLLFLLPCLGSMLFAVAGILLLVYYKKCNVTMFQIAYGNTVVGMNTACLPKEELDYFEHMVRLQKDAVTEAEPEAVVTTPVAPVTPVTPVTPAESSDSVEQLRRYKTLMDEGVISAEDYEAKKRQLLGL